MQNARCDSFPPQSCLRIEFVISKKGDDFLYFAGLFNVVVLLSGYRFFYLFTSVLLPLKYLKTDALNLNLFRLLFVMKIELNSFLQMYSIFPALLLS